MTDRGRKKELLIVSFAAGVFFFGLLLMPGLVSAQEKASWPGAKRIMLLHSYHPEYSWVQEITSGVKDAIATRRDIDLEIVYMDTKRNTTLEWKAQAGKIAQEKINSFAPEAVIACDDNTQVFVTQKYAGKGKPYFVFCGVNAEPQDYGFPAANVTGILERPNMQEAIKYLKQIAPAVRKVAVISDDGPTSLGALAFMEEQKIPVKVIGYHLIGDFDTWKQRVRQYSIEADALLIYMYHTIKEHKDAAISMSPQDVLTWTKNNCTIPTVGFFEFGVEDGMLCGLVESGHEHGFEAAKIALALIDGADIKNFPVKMADKGEHLLNLDTAARLKLDIPMPLLEAADRIIR
ncbi:MAG: ABC transporter substrate binding protein [Candidatus Omnitrophota bacterium]